MIEGAGGADPSTDALWLHTLQRVYGRAAHEVKGALNGVSVNLEVVRTRAAKPEAPASAVGKFATSAADQLEGLITMTDALLALGRPAREPAEIGRTVAQLGALLVPAARADGRQLSIDADFDDAMPTSASPTLVRAAVGGGLLAALEQSRDIACRPVRAEETTGVRIESRDGSTLSLGPDLMAALRGSAVQLVADDAAITISFPRSGAAHSNT